MHKFYFNKTWDNIIALILNILLLPFYMFAGMFFIGDLLLLSIYVTANIAAFILLTFFIDIKIKVLNLLFKVACLYGVSQLTMRLIYTFGDPKYF